MQKKLVAVVMMLFVSALVVSCGGGKTSSVKPNTPANDMVGEAEGYGTIFDGDTALARDRAIDDAMNKLVKSKLGSMVSGTTLVEDYQLVSSIVEVQSSGMVKNWSVIKQSSADGAFIVTIRGEVYPQAVNDTIEATLRNYGRPKFMVLINESLEGQTNTPGMTFTELTMIETMSNQGFEFVDAARTKELMRTERARMASAMGGQVTGDVQKLLLDDVGAEVIITGVVTTSDQSAAAGNVNPALRNMKSKQAIINLKAIDIYTGRILATVSFNGAGLHIDANAAAQKAIQGALKSKRVLGANNEDGKFMSGDFMNQITKKFLQAATKRMIMLTITGLDYTELTKFRNILQERVRGVQKVYPRGQVGQAANIEVEFAGKVGDLADELNAKGSKFGYSIEIKSTFPNKIVLSVKKNK